VERVELRFAVGVAGIASNPAGESLADPGAGHDHQATDRKGQHGDHHAERALQCQQEVRVHASPDGGGEPGVSTSNVCGPGTPATKIQARTIDELIEKSGPHAPALRELDALIVAAAPELERRLFSGPSITMIGYGELVWRNMSSSGVWPVIAVALQKHQVSMYVAAEWGGVPLVQNYVGRLGRADFGKNCVRFKRFEGLDRAALTALVREAVAAAAVQSRMYGRDCARPVEGRSKARPRAPTSKGLHRR